jgi:hypothetical protein
VIGTYAAALAVCVASLTLGQAAISLCGSRRWSWLAPAVGLAILCAVSWGTVRLPGHGSISAIVVLLLVAASAAYLQGRLEGWGDGLRAGWPVALIALLAASLPFAVEGHFGILGTSFNPDMSQHLLATYQLAHGHSSELLNQGYPLGPHAIVVALNKGLDVNFVHGFSGLMVAVSILAPLTALAAFAELRPLPRTAAALVVGLAYVVASYFAQGAFKETMEALFLLAFVLALRETTRAWRDLQFRFVPAALLAVGAAYTYSFPGLLWLLGTAVIWALAELALTRRRPSADLVRPVGAGLIVFVVLVAPEIGRMIEFQKFETFNPNGPGLGNLFGQVSPFEALGIWPSGDFRLAPGDGAVPAAAYYLGAAFGLVLLLYGIWRLGRRRETAILAGLATAAIAYIAARAGGTAYTAAKAIEIGAPLAALTIVAPLVREGDWRLLLAMREKVAKGGTGSSARGGAGAAADPADDRRGLIVAAAGAVFLLAAGVCSILALANAPVGPTNYSPALTWLRPLVANDSTLVLASPTLLAEQHGTPYIAWELRGGRVCIETREEAAGKPPPGVRYVVTSGSQRRPPFPGLRIRKVAPPYVLWETKRKPSGKSPCPLIAVRQARQGPAR